MSKTDPALALDPRVRAAVAEWRSLAEQNGSKPSEIDETVAGLAKLPVKDALELLLFAASRLAGSIA